MPQFSDVSDIQLQLQDLELEHELGIKKLELQQEERQRERECQKEERQQQLELKKLELEMSRASDPSARLTYPPSSRPPPLRVEAAVKLVSTGKFSENDVETFLISFLRR